MEPILLTFLCSTSKFNPRCRSCSFRLPRRLASFRGNQDTKRALLFFAIHICKKPPQHGQYFALRYIFFHYNMNRVYYIHVLCFLSVYYLFSPLPLLISDMADYFPSVALFCFFFSKKAALASRRFVAIRHRKTVL